MTFAEIYGTLTSIATVREITTISSFPEYRHLEQCFLNTDYSDIRNNCDSTWANMAWDTDPSWDINDLPPIATVTDISSYNQQYGGYFQ